VETWSDARIWAAVDAHRWFPPSSQRVTTPNYELAVTSGSATLTWVYGFDAPDGPSAEHYLDEVQRAIQSHGGLGTRIQFGPHVRPSDLADRLQRRGYRELPKTEVLAWELRDHEKTVRIPEFRRVPGLTCHELTTDEEYNAFIDLSPRIFEDPPPPPEVRALFLRDIRAKVRDTGHSERYMAWYGSVPVGRAGMEVDGPIVWLWGTGVLPEHRRRGAYGELVRVRCEDAVQRGAKIALVTAQIGTSGPILKHHGFRVVGAVQTFQAQW
jgi:Acetyltransferase (GNAT) domain